MNPLGNNPAPESQDWRTPPALFHALHSIFQFDIDAAADEGNALLPTYWTKTKWGGALSWPWVNRRAFCNPPWSMTEEFVRKGHKARVAVFLVSANSLTSAYVADYPPLLICYPAARVKYLHPNRDEPSNPAHGTAILIYGRDVYVDEVVPKLAEIGTVFKLAGRYVPPPPPPTPDEWPDGASEI
ncbi:MAG: phage N-6-adenine-methyltransferase [Gemmataceae bacterium]|nr:phage N-6-adenine-methyltransferase [Gemmataceae bacterium]